jgi:uncharacterized protein
LRFLVRLVPSTEDRPSTVRLIRDLASSIGAKVVNPKWTSYGALEIDLFAESRSDLDLFLAVIEPVGKLEFWNDLQVARSYGSRERAVSEAVSLFNSERFWEAHEVLESLWRVSEGDEKVTLQGLILVCAALVHVQKGEMDVALGILRRARPKLELDDRLYDGVDIKKVRARVASILDRGRAEVFGI